MGFEPMISELQVGYRNVRHRHDLLSGLLAVVSRISRFMKESRRLLKYEPYSSSYKHSTHKIQKKILRDLCTETVYRPIGMLCPLPFSKDSTVCGLIGWKGRGGWSPYTLRKQHFLCAVGSLFNRYKVKGVYKVNTGK